MSLIVETGAGLVDAESYISEADTDAYHLNHTDSSDWSGATTEVKEDALRVATQYLDAVYRLRWLGRRTNETQRLSWPRMGAVDSDEYVLPSDDLPRQLEEACAEAALLHITEANGLLPPVSDPGIERENVAVGPLKSDITYSGTKTGVPQFTIVRMLIKGLITQSGLLERA